MSNSVQICGADIPSEVFEWLAKGQQIQTNICGWTTCSAEGVLRQMLNGNATFRLKPRTVKIGSREVEAPVLEPADGQTLWFTNSSGVAQSSMFEGESGVKAKRVSGGRYFASEAAAIAAHEAISALLTGGIA